MSSITAFTSTSKSICSYLFVFVIHNNVTADLRATTDISTASMLGASMDFTTPGIMTTATPVVNMGTASYLSSITINTVNVAITITPHDSIIPHDSITPSLASATRTSMITTTTTTASSGSSTILDASTSDMSMTTTTSSVDIITTTSSVDIITTTSSVTMTTTTLSEGTTNSPSGMPTGI